MDIPPMIRMVETETTAVLSEKLQILAEHIDDLPEVTFTYFEPDKKKSGGAYVRVTGRVSEIDEYEHIVVLADGTKIPIHHMP